VETTTSVIVSGMTGWPVDLVLYDDGHTRLIKAEIEGTMPLRLKVIDPNARGIRAARRVMLLAKQDHVAMRADGHLDQVRHEADGLRLEIGQVQWELLERRRHVRVPVSISVSIRAVVENDDAPAVDNLEGKTVDLSISGAFVKVSPVPVEGSLIEMKMVLDGEPVRMLAVVAHAAGPGSGVGLHFVEYLDNARFLLHDFLTQAA
jgi:hypothetical protein